MRKSWLIGFVLILALALGGFVFRGKIFKGGGQAALQISSTPAATVFIDGSQVGITPFFDKKIAAGEHTIKLVPEASKGQLVSWEGKVSLAPNIMTVISRTLGPSEALSSGKILSLEKIAKKNVSSLAVVSIPDRAVVKINGEPRGFTPTLVEDLAAGDYQVVVSATGYEEKTVSARTVTGYKLTVTVQLAKKGKEVKEASPSAEKKETETTPTPTTAAKTKTTPTPSVEKPYVLIKDTPTGWLRVRMGVDFGDRSRQS
jgi:hypothetical protein